MAPTDSPDTPHTGSDRPADKLAALRLGRRLVTEVPASRPGHRFGLKRREYDGERLDGFDYDIGAVLVASAEAADEAGLLAVLTAWGLRPGAFAYPWETGDPR
ncbi:hypothetical protein ACXNSR_24640 [Streptomyces sp. NC-S4]